MLLVLALATAACDGGGGDDAADTTTTTAADADGGATATTDPAIRIVLGPGRVTVAGNAVPFGAPAFQVSSFLERGLGEPAEEEDQQCDAGQLRVVAWPTLTVYVAAEGLAGWHTDDDTHATDKDIRVGSSQSELQAAYPTGQVTESTLGTEFFVDGGDGNGLSAILEGGKATNLWSGATCVAR